MQAKATRLIQFTLLKLVTLVQGSIRLKLFSLNDYMGLSQHPAICRAAGDTAVQCGMGTCCPCITKATLPAAALRFHVDCCVHGT